MTVETPLDSDFRRVHPSSVPLSPGHGAEIIAFLLTPSSGDPAISGFIAVCAEQLRATLSKEATL